MIVQLPDGTLWQDNGDGTYTQIASGFDDPIYNEIDFGTVTQLDSLPAPGESPPPTPEPGTYYIGPTGTFEQAAAAPPATPSPPPPPAAAAASFKWGDRTWLPGDLYTFIAYLSAHGIAYETWAANHPAAAAIFQVDYSDPLREPQSHSLGQALAAYIAAGDTPAQAAERAEALRAALVKVGLVAVTPAQLLEDAKIVASTIAAEQGQPPPAGQPDTGEPEPPGGRRLQSVDASQRTPAEFQNLPVVPYPIKVIVNGLVTEAAIVAASLIEHGDIWIGLGTCKVESGFNLEHGKNSASAVGPMQIVGFPVYDGSIPEAEWAWANLIAGARMLANYEAAYNGNQPKVSAAYNAGPGAVNSHWPAVLRYLEIAGNPAAGTVQDYVDNVATWANRYRSKFGNGYGVDPITWQLNNGVPASSPAAPPAEPEYQPAGVVAQWHGIIDVLKRGVPAQRAAVQSAADALIEVFK